MSASGRSASARAAAASLDWWRDQIARLIPGLRAPTTAAEMMRAVLGREATPEERFTAYGAIDWLCSQNELERVGHHDDGSYAGRWTYAPADESRPRRAPGETSRAYRRAKKIGWRRGEMVLAAIDGDAENDV